MTLWPSTSSTSNAENAMGLSASRRGFSRRVASIGLMNKDDLHLQGNSPAKAASARLTLLPRAQSVPSRTIDLPGRAGRNDL
jgi:hypothetical protein